MAFATKARHGGDRYSPRHPPPGRLVCGPCGDGLSCPLQQEHGQYGPGSVPSTGLEN